MLARDLHCSDQPSGAEDLVHRDACTSPRRDLPMTVPSTDNVTSCGRKYQSLKPKSAVLVTDAGNMTQFNVRNGNRRMGITRTVFTGSARQSSSAIVKCTAAWRRNAMGAAGGVSCHGAQYARLPPEYLNCLLTGQGAIRALDSGEHVASMNGVTSSFKNSSQPTGDFRRFVHQFVRNRSTPMVHA